MLRCKQYKLFSFLGLGVASLVAGGSLMTLTGSLMPLLGKERTKDKWSNFNMMLVGALLATAGVAAFFFYQQMMFDNIRASSWYPKQNIGVSCMMAGAGAVMCIFATLPQFAKIGKDKEKDDKPGTAEETADLTAPIAIDPALL